MLKACARLRAFAILTARFGISSLPERYFPVIDGNFHRGNSTNACGKHLRNEFQEHAGIKLDMGLPIRPRAHFTERHPANRMVQVAQVGLEFPQSTKALSGSSGFVDDIPRSR